MKYGPCYACPHLGETVLLFNCFFSRYPFDASRSLSVIPFRRVTDKRIALHKIATEKSINVINALIFSGGRQMGRRGFISSQLLMSWRSVCCPKQPIQLLFLLHNTDLTITLHVQMKQKIYLTGKKKVMHDESLEKSIEVLVILNASHSVRRMRKKKPALPSLDVPGWEGDPDVAHICGAH